MIYLFLFAHLVADFMLQPYALVKRKCFWDGLLIHGAIVLVCMLLLPLADAALWALWPQMLLITAVHICADYWKVHKADKLFRQPIGPFLIDQAIHATTIMLVLGLTLAPQTVWTLSGAHFALMALYGVIYVAAAFAAPIAVMVWLDPSFQHVGLSGKARLRSMAACAAVVTLMLLGGAFALPATLVGLACLARHPRSSHPLDTPSGLLAALSVAALFASSLLFFWL
jgi:hypothetical protein